MKHIILYFIMTLCLSITLSQVCQADIEPQIEVPCGATTKVYTNTTKADSFYVTFYVLDGCSLEDSRVLVRDKRDRELNALAVPDSDELFYTVVVPPEGSIWIECNGNSGNCRITILDISRRERQIKIK